MDVSNKVSIYVHFPFCLRKCPYCDFFSYDDRKVTHGDYIGAVLAELGCLIEVMNGGRFEAASVYIGGGTPSLMRPDLVQSLIDGIDFRVPIAADAELTIEVNPATAGAVEMAAWRSAGINRISLGIQSTDRAALKTLGRIHSPGESLEAYQSARRAGFDSVSVDLIFGIPGQRRDGWMAELERVTGWEPDHLSAYMLKPPLGWETPPEDEVAEMYLTAVDTLRRAGLAQYEVSNFARPGKECRHNMVYWKKRDYIGLGAAAHSHLSNENPLSGGVEPEFLPRGPRNKDFTSIRWWNLAEPESYIARILEKGNAMEGSELIDVARDFDERLLLGLRLVEGIDMEAMNLSRNRAVREIVAHLEESGLAVILEERLMLTPRGLLLADEIAAEISALVAAACEIKVG